MASVPSVDDTLRQINAALNNPPAPSNSGANDPCHYSRYSCKTVSWDDAQRGTVGVGLSCWGANITDTRLCAKDGRRLFTVRADNWNERLGKVTSDDIALVASDNGHGGGGVTNLRPITLRSVLSDPARYGGYAGLGGVGSLLDDFLDKEVSIRFQTTFLPVDSKEKAALEFAPEAYNYNTTDDANPRNLILLCTTQGVAVQQDGAGSKRLYHHVADGGSRVHRYWLEAESSDHEVGGSQFESLEEKEDALKRGKATSSVIGVKAMGTRFNALMTIQIPLRPKTPRTFEMFCLGSPAIGPAPPEEPEFGTPTFRFQNMLQPPEATIDTANAALFEAEISAPAGMPLLDDEDSSFFFGGGGGEYRKSPDPVICGKSQAARVSRGSYVDTWDGLTVEQPERHPDEHITVTIVMYYTCSGGVPTETDVKAAVDDLESLYRSTGCDGSLAENKFSFMKSELTVKDTHDISTKLALQPPKPQAPTAWNVFPS